MFNNLYILRITSKNPKIFLNRIINRNINIENIEIYNDKIYLYVDKNNYKKILNIKTTYKIELVRLKGIIRIIYIIKRHYIFIILLFLAYIYLLFISNIIFKINVVHSNKEIRDLLYNELNKNGISKYNFFKSYEQKEKIKEKILNDNKDKLEWIEIDRSGVKYIVRVEERIIKEEKIINKKRDLVAKKDGIIMKIEASKGEIKKKIGDYVKKGDVIVSGNITKNDEIKNKVVSNGVVYAEVWYKSTIDMPFYYSENYKTGNFKKVFKLKYINKDFYIFNFNKYKTYKEKEIFTIKNNLIPVRLSYSLEYETNKKECIYTKEEALNEARKISKEKIEKKLKKEEKILQNKVIKVDDIDNGIRVTIFYKVYEDITNYNDITNNKNKNLTNN